MLKQGAEPIDDRHHLLAARYGQRSAIAKIILYIDDEQNIAVNQFDSHLLILSQSAITKPHDTRAGTNDDILRRQP